MYYELYNTIIQKASKKFNLNPEILKHVDTRLIVNALLLPNNYNIMILKSHYSEVEKRFGAWKNFNHCVNDMKRKNNYSDEVARKVCGKLKHELEKANTDIKQKLDETTDELTQNFIDKLNEKLNDALKQWEMVLKEKAKRNPDGSVIDPNFAEKFMTEVQLVARPCMKPMDGVIKSSNVAEPADVKSDDKQLHDLNQKIGEKIGEQINKPVITKDHQGPDSYHVTLYFATPEPKSEDDIRKFVESTGAIVIDYQPASGYWLDQQGQLVGDEFVHVVTVDVTPEQLKELDSKIKSEFKQSSVLITSATDIHGYSGGRILRYEVPKSEDEIRKLLIELSGQYGGATYLRGKNPAIITIAQMSEDNQKPEIYYTFT